MANSIRSPRNNILQDLRGSGTKQRGYALGGSSVSFDFFQGDLLWFDASVGYVKPLDSDAHAAYLVGVSLDSAYIAPYASMLQSGGPGMLKLYRDVALAAFGCVASFYSKAGETYADGDSVYWGGIANDPQSIQKASGSHVIGTVVAPRGSIAGGSTVLVPVLVAAQLPIQTL